MAAMSLLYRVNRLLMFTSMVLYVPLTLALVAALVWVGWRVSAGVVHWGPSAPVTPRGYAFILLFVVLLDLSIAGAAFALLAGLVKLFARFRSEPVFGVLLSPGPHKHFFELLERVCRKLHVRPPEECYLSPFSDTSISDRIVAQENGRVRKNVRTLVVGAGLLVHIRIDELTTILCHEMAHAKAGDTQLGWLATRFHYAMISAIYGSSQKHRNIRA